MKKRALHNKVHRELLKERLERENFERTTLSFYQYAQIKNIRLFRDHLYLLLNEMDVLGRIYVAHEGVNAQISVPSPEMDRFREQLNTILFLKDIRLNIAREDDGHSFIKLIVRIRDKIVADGIEDKEFNVLDKGEHVDAEAFNELISRDETVLVDMRNHYESEVGHFEGAICPDVETFRESLPIIADMLDEKKDQPLVMYCTGGIRCEKASAYMRHRGFEKVYQLEGGIIEYARQVQEKKLENKFRGKNFVFDDRLGERISDEIIAHCHQCGTPADSHTNCINDACHILFIQCTDCATAYQGCCSAQCRDFLALPADEQARLRPHTEFNGSLLPKGRYKAHHRLRELN